MKKFFFIIITVYIGLMITMIIIDDHHSVDHIDMMSIEKQYARVLTPEETIDIPLYISQEKTFITDHKNIIDARIINDQEELKVKIHAFSSQSQKVTYEETSYYFYYIQVGFEEIYSENLRLSLTSSKLKLTYVNEEVITIDIGDIYLLFHDLEQTSHIDFTRMYSIHNDQAMTGIYFEIVNKTNSEIKIIDIDPLIDQIQLDIDHIKVIQEALNKDAMIDDYLPGYESITDYFSSMNDFSFRYSSKLIIPIKHLQEYSFINRFPLIITYQYLNENYTYVIDDYLFYQHFSDLYNHHESIRTYQYHY